MEFKEYISLTDSSRITGLNGSLVIKAIESGYVDAFIRKGRYCINLSDLLEYCHLIHAGKVNISPLVKLYPMQTIEHFAVEIIPR